MESREQSEPATDFLLVVDDLHVGYGAIPALRGISLRVRRGEIVAVVGPNGAGKSSLLNTIAGLVRPKRGHVRFADRQIDRLSIEDILRSGISLVPEGRHIFASMSVEENLRLGATIRNDRDGVAKDIENLTERFPILRKRWLQPAGRLSGGEQQQLAIARALLCRPALLMLDEPSLGLAPAIIDQVYDILTDLRANGTTILVVEQNATRALKVANHTHVLSGGALRLSGTSEELINNPQFDAAYFGLAPPSPAQQA